MSKPYVRSKGSDGTESTTGIRRSGRISSSAHSPDCGSAYGGPDIRRLVGLCSYHRGMKLLRPTAFPAPQVREALAAHPVGGQLIVTASLSSAVSAVLATPALAVEWLHLAPHATAPRASRAFVARTLLDWWLPGSRCASDSACPEAIHFLFATEGLISAKVLGAA